MTQYLDLSKQIGITAGKVQAQAANPNAAVWVSAAAGTGKTHMLTNRLLRLLLQHPHLPANRILAITYTKAAAAEMRLRLFEVLAKWVYAPEDDLKQKLEEFLDQPSTEQLRRHARTLYTRLIDDPEGVGISTIHSFCEQILRQFPIEAGLSAGFSVLDSADEAKLLAQAVALTLTEAPAQHPEALALVAEAAGDNALFGWLTGLVQGDEGRRLQRYLGQFPNLDAAEDHLASTLKVNRNTPPSPNLTMADIPIDLCRTLIQIWSQSGKTGEKLASQLQTTLNTPPEAAWPMYQQVWLTAKLEPKAAKSLFTKVAIDRLGGQLQTAVAEQQRVYEATKTLAAWHSFNITRAVMRLALSALQHYKTLKDNRAAVDFADLIHHTHRLLHTPGLQDWVRFKLDRRIHHILLDEAQDTDSEQWAILRAFTDEFYAGQGQHEEARTLFAVGDMKQSIYRFRGAEPEVFAAINPYLAEKTVNIGQPFAPLNMATSFRSAPAVLGFVDAVFANPQHLHTLDKYAADQLKHTAHKVGAGGAVTLWQPVGKTGDAPEATPWQPATLQSPRTTPESQVHAQVVATIQHIISSRLHLGTLDRPAELGDILILLRDRSALGQLVAALDSAGLPHTGADRLNLQQTPAVQDLVAIGWALHNPALDLPLAHTLRGSFFGLTDSELNQLKERQLASNLPTLWAALNTATTAPFTTYLATLKHWQTLAEKRTPAALYKQILRQHRGRHRLLTRFGHTADDLGWLDPIEAFLTLAEDFSQKELTGLPGFLNWFSAQNTSHKKETAAAPGQIRVMTIHGAKGLEAPIVFLPDLLTPRDSRTSSLWWYKPEGAKTPTLVIHPGGLKSDAITAEEEREKIRQEADEARLLYVALTRARDRLYIGGTTGRSNNVKEDSLYHRMAHSLKTLGATEQGTTLHYEEPLNQAYPIKPPVLTRRPETLATLPAFTQNPARSEKTKLPIRASHGLGQNLLNTAITHAQNTALTKGQHLHKLLELLAQPGVTAPTAQATRYLTRFATDLDEAARAQVLQQALRVLNKHPQLFTPESRAEVSLRIETADTIQNLRIDRLHITPEAIDIIDFKSDHAATPEAITAYTAQLATYREAIARIYPNTPIRTGLLWTAHPDAKLEWLS